MQLPGSSQFVIIGHLESITDNNSKVTAVPLFLIRIFSDGLANAGVPKEYSFNPAVSSFLQDKANMLKRKTQITGFMNTGFR